MGCRNGGDPLSLELRMGRSQKGCCAGTLLPQAVLNHVDLVILSPTLKITGPTSIFALRPTAAFAARLYRLSSGWFFLVAGALTKVYMGPICWYLGPIESTWQGWDGSSNLGVAKLAGDTDLAFARGVLDFGLQMYMPGGLRPQRV